MQQLLKHKTVEHCEVDGALSDMFDGLGIANNKVDHPLFRRAIEKVRNAPPDWKLPCSITLGGTILEAQYQVNVDERSDALRHEGVKKFGLTATTDGATIHGGDRAPPRVPLTGPATWPAALLE